MDKIFISGPITGVENYELAFNDREMVLKEMGYIVVNAVTVGNNLEKRLHRKPKYEEYMRETLSKLLECDCISLLPGWEDSKGANFEAKTAEIAGIPEIKVNMLKKGW